MTRSNGILSILSFFLITLFPRVCYPQCTQLIGSGSVEAKPYIWRKSDNEDSLTGALPDLATIIAGEIALPMPVKYVGPWARAQHALRLGNIDLLWGALRNKEREEYADFVPTPLARVRSVVLSRKEDDWQFSKLSDLDGRTGVLTLGDSYGDQFDTYASERLTITRVAKADQAIKMILAKRADYLVLDEAIARATLASIGIDKLKVSKAEVSGQDLFLLISKKSRCNNSVLQNRLNSALLSHQQRKTIDKLLKSYWD